MRVIDGITGQRLSVDEAYDRFFDGFYNLGKPTEIFTATMVMAPPPRQPVRARRAKARRSGIRGRGLRHTARH
ncbi:MAG TPA: hypothetical protein VFZ90_00450 [Gemmatimonadales bacterium]|jgi:hypothetical protein